ncbi:MAG: hypothetical protein KC589_11285 [Nanoarchaeota archaeon]|nr:hypothetical protein [Nanoarchaeota archaeon]MCA9497505.1 hypothetical protein [Nanoarchaeota archaeon]
MDGEKYSKEKLSEMIVIAMVLGVTILGVILIIVDMNNSNNEMQKEDIQTNFEDNNGDIKNNLGNQVVEKEYKFDECVRKDNTYDLDCNNELASKKAYDTLDIEYCQYLKQNEDFLVYECELEISRSSSVENDNISYCYKTLNKDIIKNCEDNFVDIMYKDVILRFCDEENIDSDCYNSYVYNQALSKISPFENVSSIKLDCSLIKGVDERKDCKNFIKIRDKSKPDFCSEMSSDFFLKLCEEMIN